MQSLTDTLDSILDAHPELVEQAKDGDETAMNRLIAKVMDHAGIDADSASVTVARALQTEGSFTPGMDVDGFSEHMERLVDRGDRSEWTRQGYVRTVTKFAEWYEETHDDQVPPTADHVREWLDRLAMDQGLSGASIQRHYHALNAYFDWTGRSGELNDINVSDDYPDRGGGTPQHLPWNQVLELREATTDDTPMVVCLNADCDEEVFMPNKTSDNYDDPPRCYTCRSRRTAWSRNPYEFLIVQLLSGLGIRLGELAALNVDDYDLENRTITIRRQKRRTSWHDEMYLLDDDVWALREFRKYRDKEFAHLEGNKMVPPAIESDALIITRRYGKTGWRAHTDMLRRKLKRVAIRADIATYEDDDGETRTKVSPHILRHSVGAKLAQEGFTEFQVKTYLGHSRSGTTERYMALDASQTQEMREALG